MDKFITAIGTVALAVILLFVGSCITGTIIWALWDDVVPYFFSNAIANGLPYAPTWWKCVMLTWFTGLLIGKSTTTSSND